MNTISKERLEEKRAAARLLTEYKHEDVRLAAQENVQVIDELLALRKEREAAVPVAVVDVQSGRDDGNKFAFIFTQAAHKLSDDVHYLFAVPPAPPVAVPDAMPETVSEDGNDIDYMEPSAVYELGKTHGWNAFRAAMLAAPSKPVAAGWIVCSERMPEIGDEILYYCEDDGLRDCGIVSSSNFTGRGDAELFVHSEGFDLHLGADITHWMPLPEAPGKDG